MFFGYELKYAIIFALIFSFLIGTASLKKLKEARIEIHPEKIRYVNVKGSEAPPCGEVLLSEIEKIHNIDMDTIEIQTKCGKKHHLRVALLSNADRHLLEAELMKRSNYEKLSCLACGFPMDETHQTCPKCGWTFKT